MHLEQHRLALKPQSPSSSSRILDIPCKVCGDFSSGKHYNIFACDGCAGFFKRSIRRNRQYVCKAKEEGSCVIDKTHRNQCRACRLKKCQNVGMNKDAVQHERGPRNSTLRRQQMSSFYNDSRVMVSPPGNVLNLTMPKYESNPSMVDHAMPLLPPAGFLCNNFLPMPQAPPLPLPPVFAPAMLNPSAICESAAQLLFMNVQWVRSIPAFTSLPLSDQLLLLEESWLDLFILGAAQFLPLMDLNVVVQACGVLQQEPQRAESFLKDVNEFQEALKKISQFQLDPHEYACLRAIVLFKTSFDKPSSSNQERTTAENAKISVIQDDAQMRLNKHVSVTYPKQPLRFGKILLLASSTFRTISASTIEELFFKKVIRDTPIVAIISNMYKNQL
ncbi:tailless [Asbolus verrucosus]|uniref:Tailless n=1 Tax=Asbolus verrucosus TaxID=1661398 RepID=A0A482VYE8_ASBVE|nr:tailless [Asbolus verrucosus]